jgi:acyl dehydratase
MRGQLPAAGERLLDIVVGPFDALAVAGYAIASDDHNPLHVDAAFATAAGFAAPPVQGMRLLAAVESALIDWRPDMRLKQLAGTFALPLLVGEQARLSARVMRVDAHKAEVLMRILIQGPQRGPSVVAEAILTPVPAVSAVIAA